jgi:hypothetical protein
MKDPMRRILFFAGVLVLGASATIPAQWLNYKTPGVPRTPDGKPKLDTPAPRTADGRPDERVRWVAGQVLITSKPGLGTVITVRAPAARNADAEGALAVGTP